jgi:hypothetical protein
MQSRLARIAITLSTIVAVALAGAASIKGF